MAIRTGPLADLGLVARTIGRSSRIVVAAPADPARFGTPKIPADLARHTCLRLTGYARLAEWPMRVDGTVVPLKVAGSVSCDSADVPLEMTLAGLGIARLAAFLIDDAVASGRRRRCSPTTMSRRPCRSPP